MRYFHVSILLCLSSISLGCNTAHYHDLKNEDYQSSNSQIHCHLDDLSWLMWACGDSTKLQQCTHDQEIIGYYSHYKPDSAMDYYILSVNAKLQTPNGRDVKIRFDSLHLRYDNQAILLNVNDLLQREWVYSNGNYTGLEPIPIPKSIQEAFLDISITILNKDNSEKADIVNLTLPVERKKLTRTPLNPWP